MHYRACSGREQDSTTQGWLESQVEIGKELKRNRHLVRSSLIWTAELGQVGIQAEVKLAVGTVSPKEISPGIPSRRDSSCLQSASITMPSDQRIVINN